MGTRRGLFRKEKGEKPWVIDYGLRSFSSIWELHVMKRNLSDLVCMTCKGGKAIHNHCDDAS